VATFDPLYHPVDVAEYLEFADLLEPGFIDFEATSFSLIERMVSEITTFSIPVYLSSP
jgi:hypothetical protein